MFHSSISNLKDTVSLTYYMELFVVSVVLILALILYFCLSSLNKTKAIIDGTKLPPGNMGWPLIGESLEFLKEGRRGDPEKFIKDRMQKFSSQVFKTSLFGETTAVFCGAMGNKFLFTNHNKLVGAWWPHSFEKLFPTSQSISEETVRVRKMLPSVLKPEALQRYVGVMDVIARRHLETNWDNKKEVMVCPLVKNYTLSLACKVFLSIDDPVQFERFADVFSILVTGIISLPIDFPRTRFNRGIKASSLIRKEIQEIIKQRKMDLAEKKASPTQDILSQMLTTSAEDGAFLNETDIGSKILGLLVAGHDTASGVLTSIVKYLAELPHVYDEVLKEQTKIAEMKMSGEMLNWDDIQKMKYSWNVTCEVMRLIPPSQGTFRVAITDFTYAGFSIPKGWKLYWNTYTTQMNPDYFPNPEKFDPSRFEGNGPPPYTFVPFGGGPKMCPGQEYARLEILVFMHHLVRKYKWEKSLPNEKIVLDPFPMPSQGLPIRIQAHNMR